MSLEKRGNRTYYYRGRRVGGRFRKEYVGGGAEAEAIAQARRPIAPGGRRSS